MSSGSDSVAVDVSTQAMLARLDALPITRLHLGILLLAGLGYMFDVAEMAVGGVLSAVFSAPPYSIPARPLSWLLASVFLGAIVGAPLAGGLADRLGRKLLLVIALVVLAATSALAGLSWDIVWLSLFRGLSGLALGAYPPLFVAYLTDLLPARRRGSLTMLAGTLACLAPLAVTFGIRWLEPVRPFGLAGWRCGLLIGAAGAALVAAGLSAMPESVRFLLVRGDLASARRVLDRFERAARGTVLGTSLTAKSPVQPHSSARKDRSPWILVPLGFLHPWATMGFPLLSGAILVHKGFAVTDSLLYLGIAMIGPLPGGLVAAAIVDRIPRRAALAICASAMAVLALAFGLATAPAALIVTSLTFAMFTSCYVQLVTLYTSESFPTSIRGWGSSNGWAANRVGSALVPLALLPLLHHAGAVWVLAVMAGALAASVALVLALGPTGQAGRPVS
jgi:MFS transporter, putative metabolite:H+ symporter